MAAHGKGVGMAGGVRRLASWEGVEAASAYERMQSGVTRHRPLPSASSRKLGLLPVDSFGNRLIVASIVEGRQRPAGVCPHLPRSPHLQTHLYDQLWETSHPRRRGMEAAPHPMRVMCLD